MYTYLIQATYKDKLTKISVLADSTIHAKLIAEWHFGIGSVVNTPTKIAENNISPLQTPEQAKVKALQVQADRAKQAVKAEKARQTIAKGHKLLVKAFKPTA